MPGVSRKSAALLIAALLSFTMALAAATENVWVLGSYHNKPNALAEQARLARLLSARVMIVPFEAQSTYRVVTPLTEVTWNRLVDAGVPAWPLSIDLDTGEPGEVAATVSPKIERTDAAPDKFDYIAQLAPREPGPADDVRAEPLANIAQDVAVPEPSEAHEPPADKVAKARTPAKATDDQKPAFVPPGFEELLEPQTTLVDVYYGGEFLVATTATFTPTYITFLTPQEITERIPDILSPETVGQELSGELPTHTEFACLKSNQTNCGDLDTDSVDVIFDDGRFRADLFIAPELLSVRPAVASKFLPPSSAGFSVLDVAAATFTGENKGGSRNFNIGNSTTLAYKEGRLIMVSNYTRSDKFTVDTLALQREFNGRQWQAGLFRSTPGNMVFIREADFAGISIASSLDTRKDLDQSSGNDLQVFLDTRSRVDIIKDGRLISTAVYETGNQILDTSQLPGGAYEITLRIRDNFGNVSEETRFYVKTNRLPPKDQMLYFFDVGERTSRPASATLPETIGVRIARAGISKRLTSDFGGDLGILSSNGDMLYEAGLFKLGRFYDLRLSYAASNDHAQGINVNARTRLGPLALNINARKVETDEPTSILGTELTQSSVNLTVPIGRASLNFTSRYNKRPDNVEENYGFRLDFPTYTFGNNVFDASFQVTENNDDLLFLLGARLSLKSGRWQNRISSRYYSDRPNDMPTENGAITNLAANWQDGDRFLSDVSWTMRANDEQQDRTLESELDIASRLGRANLEAVYSTESKRLNYGANLFTSFIANGDSFSVGGKRQARSAVIVDIDGDVEDAFFDVQVDGTSRANAEIGRKTIVALAPYETYEVGLNPRGDAIVDFNNRRHTVTLYPGNVVTLKWEATRVLVAFGQIVDADGNPIANALIEGVVGLATTDEFGLFQAEIESSTRTLNVRTRTRECTVELPEYDTSQMIAMLNELVCR